MTGQLASPEPCTYLVKSFGTLEHKSQCQWTHLAYAWYNIYQNPVTIPNNENSCWQAFRTETFHIYLSYHAALFLIAIRTFYLGQLVWHIWNMHCFLWITIFWAPVQRFADHFRRDTITSKTFANVFTSNHWIFIHGKPYCTFNKSLLCVIRLVGDWNGLWLRHHVSVLRQSCYVIFITMNKRWVSNQDAGD